MALPRWPIRQTSEVARRRPGCPRQGPMHMGPRYSQIVDAGTTGVNDLYSPRHRRAEVLELLVHGAHGNSTPRPGPPGLDPLGTRRPMATREVRPTLAMRDGQQSISSGILPTVISDPANVGGTPVQITYTSPGHRRERCASPSTRTRQNHVATVTVAFGTPLAATTTYNYNAQKAAAKRRRSAESHDCQLHGFVPRADGH